MEEKETKIIYHVDDEETPYLVKLPIAPDKVTLADFKNVFNRPNYKFFFKSMDDDFGVVKEEIMEDDAHLPCFNGRVVSWLVSAEGSNVSDGGASQCTDSVARIADHGSPRPNNDDLMSTETESLASSKPAVHHMPKERMRPPVDRYEKYHKYNGLGVNGHSKHRNMGLGYDTSSMMSSELETTSFLESDDDASSRITTTTGRASNLLLDGHGRRRAPRRKRHRQATAMSRTSSFSSITDSSMSLNIITVTLNMDTVNFLGISIVGQSNNGGDGGIYVGSIMKGGAVALDGRIEPGDMILQVNDINFENMSNDEAVRVLREVVQKPGAIKLVVAKCWDPNPKGYFTIPRTEPVRPIDPGAWVAHTAAMRGETYPLRPPSVSTLTSTSSSLISSIAETEIAADTIDNVSLTVNTDMAIIVKAMAKPNSGLEIRDRLWLKITIPNAFIGADVVDWLETHVEGFTERREARRYASQLLKAGYIRHCVNKSSFSEQCYYIFGEAFSVTAAMSRLKLEEPERDNLPHPGSTWDMPYSGTYLPHSSPMPFNYTNDTTCYSLTRDGSGSGGSRSGSDIMGPNMPLMKTAASGASSSGGGGTSTNVSKNDPNGKQRAMIGSSGSETSSNPAYSQDLSASQQSFKMAMGNPCEFFVDVM
ncbi:hypothetical protein V9T40_008162 [Parthenolecanium corni]|uniref:Dishevelled n=1 Tax=Parthenolecanium corni TaxID=536013 RepID=A0AAN9U1N7_9HEMI